MPYSSLIALSQLSSQQIQDLFLSAETIQKEPAHISISKGTAALIFFEPSTRTRMSFEMAAVQEGFYPVRFDGANGTSLEKGETLEDTLLNIAAMKPQMMVIRSGAELDFHQLQKKVNIPIINAGWGAYGHPSQALLDMFTITREFSDFKKIKLLILGDIKHSRVASSHVELAKILGHKLAFCGPSFLTENSQGIERFHKLDEALKWANIVMPLRVQHERHQEKMNLADYISDYGLTKNKLAQASKDLMILHPGPVNHGVEIDSEVYFDSRSRILLQVENGIYIRRAIIRKLIQASRGLPNQEQKAGII